MLYLLAYFCPKRKLSFRNGYISVTYRHIRRPNRLVFNTYALLNLPSNYLYVPYNEVSVVHPPAYETSSSDARNSLHKDTDLAHIVRLIQERAADTS
jgi:hypothetical protein